MQQSRLRKSDHSLYRPGTHRLRSSDGPAAWRWHAGRADYQGGTWWV